MAAPMPMKSPALLLEGGCVAIVCGGFETRNGGREPARAPASPGLLVRTAGFARALGFERFIRAGSVGRPGVRRPGVDGGFPSAGGNSGSVSSAGGRSRLMPSASRHLPAASRNSFIDW